MKLVNCTPHNITILKGKGGYDEAKHYQMDMVDSISVIAPSGNVARVRQEETVVEKGLPFPCVMLTYGEIENLPEPEEDTIYIVSSLVLNAAKALGRTDCCTVARVVYDEATHAVRGCGALSF